MIKTTLLLLLLLPITVFAQDLDKIKGINARHFQLKETSSIVLSGLTSIPVNYNL